MSYSPHILLVEDDREISELVTHFLRSNDMRVSKAGDALEMDKILQASRVDLVVLDVMLPSEDGLSICRRLQSSSGPPVILLTSKGEEHDRIIGLETGADDYLTKPFNPHELLARIRAVLRRSAASVAGSGSSRQILMFDGWRLDIKLRRLHNSEGIRVALTGAEFELLLVFCARPGRVLSREQLLDLTQGRAALPLERSIDILVSRLRQKMEKDPREPTLIQTVRSEGYMFSPEVKSL